MNKLLTILVCAAVALPTFAKDDKEKTDTVGFQFTDIKIIPTTGVKDQNKSGTCWCFSGTSFFEDEILRQGGDSVHLSEMYTVRKCYDDKVKKYVRMYGNSHLASGGACPDVAYVMETYGAIPNEVYSGLQYGEDKHVHGELDNMLKSMADVVVKKPNGKISTAWHDAVEGVFDAYFGEVPETFTYKGKTYTPKTYFESLGLNMDDYVGITSFNHHPFYSSFVLEIPDNWLNGEYYNVPLEDLKQIIDNAVDNGFPIAWAADVSEKGFKWADGVALMPKAKTEADLSGTELARWVTLSDADRSAEQYKFTGPVEEIVVTQESRQEMFDNQLTTDDHGMEIIGTAKDQNGNRYYKVKNSWDTNQKYGGYLYVSEPYIMAKTMDIYVHKDAVPEAIAKKLKIKK